MLDLDPEGREGVVGVEAVVLRRGLRLNDTNGRQQRQ